MRAALERGVLARWYGKPGILLLLLPLSWLYRGILHWRLRSQVRSVPQVSGIAVPVIVVGNITVGGSGKTPLVLWLAQALRERGLKPGVIARGYGGHGPFPLQVGVDTSPAQCGDEPALIARVAGVPVVVDPDRARALAAICSLGVDVVISDDGLQHVALPRSVEIVVVDHRRRFGNGYCLPVGPLRESPARLATADFVVGNGGDAGVGAVPMQLHPTHMHAVDDPSRYCSVEDFLQKHGPSVTAVAGIGDPSRFFATLRTLGFQPDEHPFPDHHAFSAADFPAGKSGVVVMTAKDAVKCRDLPGLSGRPMWYLAVEAVLPPGFIDQVVARAGLAAGNVKPGDDSSRK